MGVHVLIIHDTLAQDTLLSYDQRSCNERVMVQEMVHQALEEMGL